MGRKVNGAYRTISIPIINAGREIVAWITNTPEIVSGAVRHSEAERIIGRIECLYVEIRNPEDAARAGAPPGWKGPWRCMALCDARVLDEGPDVRIEVCQPEPHDSA